MIANQNPEQPAHNNSATFDRYVYLKKQIDAAVSRGAVCVCLTDIDPTDYILFVNQKLIGDIEAMPEQESVRASLLCLISTANTTLTSFNKTIDKNFQKWIFKKQAGTLKYTEEQVWGLRMIEDYIANSFHVDRDDFELNPFNKQSGLGKMWQLFGEETDEIIELKERLVA